MRYFSKLASVLIIVLLLSPEAFAVKVMKFPSETGVEVPATSGTLTAGNCVKVGADGTSVADAGAACGTAGGDNVTVNTTAIDTTANLKDTATVTWAVVDGGAGGPDDVQATAVDVTCTNCLTKTEVASADAATALEADGGNCSAGNAPLGVDTLGAVQSCTDFEEEVTEGSLADSTIVSADIKDATIAAGDLASGVLAPREFWWQAAGTLPLEVGDSIPPIAKDAGTNIDQLPVDFDDSTDECRTVSFKVPARVESGSTITFTAHWYSAAATTGDAIHDFRHNGGVADGTDPDQTLTVEADGADTTSGTAGQLNISTWTETLANLGWAANEQVDAEFCRDANAAGDTLVGDSREVGFGVSVPLA